MLFFLSTIICPSNMSTLYGRIHTFSFREEKRNENKTDSVSGEVKGNEKKNKGYTWFTFKIYQTKNLVSHDFS